MPRSRSTAQKVLQNRINPDFDKVRRRFLLWNVVEKFVDIVDKSVDN